MNEQEQQSMACPPSPQARRARTVLKRISALLFVVAAFVRFAYLAPALCALPVELRAVAMCLGAVILASGVAILLLVWSLDR